MARGRIISKSWSTSRKRAAIYRTAESLAEFCLQLFPLLVAHSDDYGRLDGDAETVKLICDPGSPRSIEEFDEALTRMHTVGLIQRYVVQGVTWLQIVKFDEHQPGLLSKRTKAVSPAPSTDTELPGISVPTKPNLIEPNLTEDSVRTSSADIVGLWNQLVTPPIPQVTKLTTDRRAKIDARLKSFPDLATWRTAILWVNGQDWCRAPGRGDHPNWTATLDWLVKNDGTVQRCLERAAVPDVKPPASAWHEWKCPDTPTCPAGTTINDCHKRSLLETGRRQRMGRA